MKCPNKNLKEWQELEAARPDLAYKIWNDNDGHGLDRAPNGAPSILFETLLKEHNGDRIAATQEKSRIYTNEFKSSFGDWLNNKDSISKDLLDKNGEPYLINTPEKKSADSQLNKQISNWLKRVGIDYRAMERILDSDGNKINSVARANILEGVIEVIEGKQDITTLPEEAAHFLVEMLVGTPLYDRLANATMNSETYAQVVADYSDVYNGDQERIMKEAMGKLIAEAIINENQSNQEQKETVNAIKRIYDKIIQFLKDLFTKGHLVSSDIESFKEAANIILNNDTSTLRSLKDVQEGITNDLYYYQLNTDQVANKNALLQKLQEETIRYSPVEGKYYRQNGEEVKHRVSDLVKKYYAQLFHNEEREKTAESMFLANKGTLLHKTCEVLMQRLINQNNYNITYGDIRDQITLELSSLPDFQAWEDTFYNISDAQFTELKNGVKAVYDEIKKNQAIVNQQMSVDNNAIENQAVIKTEQIIYDEQEDRAGTVDVMVIYPNGTVGIYDYKGISFKTKYNPQTRMKEVVSGIADFKKEAYDIQLLEYKTILAEQYGVKDFAETRIIPINMQFAKTKNGQYKSDQFQVVEMGNYGDDTRFYLQQLPVAQELTHYEALNKELLKMFSLRDTMEKRIKKEPYNSTLKAELKEMDRIIQTLQTENDLQVVYREINRLSKEFDSRKLIPFDETNPKNGFLTFEDLNRMAEELKVFASFADNTRDVYKDILDKSNFTEEEKEKALLNFSGLTSTINILTNQIHSKWQDYLNRNETFDVLDDSKRIGFWGKMFNTLHEIDIPIFKKLSKLVRQTEDEAVQKINKFNDQIKEKHKSLESWAKNHGKSVQEAFDLLVNKKTGELKYKYSNKLFEDKKEAISKSNKQWFTQHYQIEKSGKDYRYTGLAKEMFEKDFANYKQKITERYPGEENKQQRERMFTYFQEQYDITYNPNAMFSNKNKYVKMDESKMEQYKTQDYKYIEQNKPLLDYYDFIKESNWMFDRITGRDFKSGFLPNMRKDFASYILNNGFSGIATMRKHILESMATQEEDTVITSEMFDPLTGKPRMTIPLLFTNKLMDALTDKEISEVENSLPDNLKKGTRSYKDALDKALLDKKFEKGLANKSYDLTRNMMLFAQMAFVYEQMSSTEAQMSAIRELAQSKNVGKVLTTTDGRQIKDKISQKAARVVGLPESEIELLEKFMNHYWYGTSQTDAEAAFSFGKKVDEEGNVIEEGKSISWVRAVSKFLSASSIVQLGFKPLVASTNVIQQTQQHFITATEGKYYDMASAIKAMKLSKSEERKMMAILEFFDIDNSQRVREEAKKLSAHNLSKIMNKEMAFGMMRWGDKLADRMAIASMLQFWGLDENGKIRKLENIKNGKSLWDLAKFDPNTNSISFEGMSRDEHRRFISMGRQAGTAVKGIINSNDIMGINTTIAGRMIMQYRTWIPGLMKARWGGLSYNEALEEHDVKRFTAMVNEIGSGAENKFKKLGRLMLSSIPILHYLNNNYDSFDMSAAKRMYNEYKEKSGDTKLTFDEFANMYQKRLAATAFELRSIVGFFMVLTLSRALAEAVPDYDDDDLIGSSINWAANMNLRQWKRAYNEAAFFIDYNSFTDIIKSPVAAMGMINNAISLIPNTVDETRDFLAGKDYKGVLLWEEDHNDKSGPFKYTSRLVPFWNAVQDFFDIYDTVVLN